MRDPSRARQIWQGPSHRHSSRSPPEDAWPSTIVRAPAQTRLPKRGVRRTRVEIRRIGPISVLKFSLIFYFCVFLVIYLALAIIWAILSASGVIDSLEQLLGTIFPSGAGISPTGQVSTRGAPPIEIDSGRSSRGCSSRGVSGSRSGRSSTCSWP